MKSERQHREDIVRFGRMLHERDYIAATDGNLSVRLDPETILVTPSAMSKGMLEPEDMVVVDRQGKKVSGRRAVSSELGMHLLIYRLRPDTHGIVHAHPPAATGYAAAGLPLNLPLISEIVLALGCVPLAKYGTPGTPELTDALEPLVSQHDAILMANHGVVTYGKDLLQAYMKMETVEHFARISLVTQLLGRHQLLSAEDVSKLVASRERYGISTPPGGLPAGCPVTETPAPRSSSASAVPDDKRFLVTREELASIVEEAMRHSKRRW